MLDDFYLILVLDLNDKAGISLAAEIGKKLISDFIGLLTSIDNLPRFIDLSCNMNMLSFEFIDATVNNINSKALFKRRTFHVPNAIQTIVNDMINLIIYCLNSIRHMKSLTFELGLTNPCIACRILNSTFN